MTDFFLAAAASLCALTSPDPNPDPGYYSFEHTARRSAIVNAEGVRIIRIEAHAGTLRVEGRPGLTNVRATGLAIASSCDALDGIKLVATRMGDTIVVRSNIPELPTWGWNRLASLDMVLELPNTIAIEIGDGGGDLEIRAVGKLTLRDGSGDVTVEDVNGPLRIFDGSGDIHIRKVHGDVRVEDASGGLSVRDVRGSVDIDQDGEGNFEALDVTGNVHVGSKGPGSIHVDGVGGDLVIDKRGSGRLDYCNVRGAIRLPRPRITGK